MAYKLSSSKAPDILPDLPGTGSIKFMLLEDTERHLTIKLSDQTLVSGLTFEMPDDKALKSFVLLVRENGVQYPDDETHWGVSLARRYL